MKKQRFRTIGIFSFIMVSTILVSLILFALGVGKENTLMVYMVGVLLITACTNGYQYGIIASIISVLSFNFFYAVPVHTLMIYNSNDIILISFFLIASLICSNLTVRFQKQLEVAQRNEKTAKLLYEMSERFINVTGKDNIIQLGVDYIYQHTTLKSRVILTDIDFELKEENLDQTRSFLVPVTGLAKQLGVLLVFHEGRCISQEDLLLIKTAANQVGIALDRELIYTEQQNIKIAMEKEQMKSSLLRSISHDLRTPLTGIVGASGLILDAKNDFDRESINHLVLDIHEQATWLTKMVRNILDMTKIESGKLHILKEPEVVDDVINEAARYVPNLYTQRKFHVNLPNELVIVPMDGKMMVQVFINLLDNAMKHTIEGGLIEITVKPDKHNVTFIVEDNGEGIEQNIIHTLFDEFVTLESAGADGKKGIGLGLAICRAVITAHGGEIHAENRLDSGAKFTFDLPQEE